MAAASLPILEWGKSVGQPKYPFIVAKALLTIVYTNATLLKPITWCFGHSGGMVCLACMCQLYTTLKSEV